jgi:chromosome segregation ATPase
MRTFILLVFCCAFVFSANAGDCGNNLNKIKSWKRFTYFYHLIKGDVADILSDAIKETAEKNNSLRQQLNEKVILLERLNADSVEKISALEKSLEASGLLIKKMREDVDKKIVSAAEIQKQISEAQSVYDNLKKQIVDYGLKMNEFQESLAEHRHLFKKALSKTDGVVRENQRLIEKFKDFVKNEDKIIEGLKKEILQNKNIVQKMQNELRIVCEANKDGLQKDLDDGNVVCQ